MLPVGLFGADAAWFVPNQLIFARSHREWDPIAADLPRHDTYRERRKHLMSVESEELAERIRDLIGHKPGVIEKRMFGGFGFMLNGNMVVGLDVDRRDPAARRPQAHRRSPAPCPAPRR